MGKLMDGQPLNWQDTKKNSELVRKKGIIQFINLYKLFQNRDYDSFKYGDEVEYSLVKFNHKEKRVYLSLRSEELIPILQNSSSKNKQTQWSPEFANFMIEGMPANPYEHDINCISQIEMNMNQRRKQVQDLLGLNEYIMTFSTFPLLGSPEFTWPNNKISKNYFPIEAVFRDNPRYLISMINNKERSKTNMCANIPIFMDKNTPAPFKDDLSAYENSNSNSKIGYIHLEGIGASCSCLQVTFQARNLDEACQLYDQLAPITPIILAISASSPIWRGMLADIDCRWKVISESLDDRTKEERGELPLLNDKYRLNKSRYDSIDCYLSTNSNELNDIEVCRDEEFYNYMLNNGIDNLISQHISHLFTRDPLILFKENLENKSENRTDLWENIQSTNWQSLRFKPPPTCDVNSSIGWRVEFRTTELQITDFENSAFVAFLVLLTRAILSFKLNLLIPISKIDENMQRAQKRDACLSNLFYFKTNMFDNEVKYKEMTIDEIINGSDNFTGLIPIIKDYLKQFDNIDLNTNCKINHYLKLIENKANGRVKTTASYMRSFVMKHPNYKFDSIVSNEIAYDLMWNLCKISNGILELNDLNGTYF